MPFCELNIGKIYYETLGKGEPLLLLRGLGRSSRYWLGYEKQLAKHFKVILIDHRATGKSSALMSWRDGLDDLARDCLAVLDKLRLQSVHVFGLSLGGMVAMSMAQQAPERIQGLIIANSSSAESSNIRFNPMSFWLLLCGLGKGCFHETLLRRTVSEAVVRSRGPEILGAWQGILAEEGFPVVPLAKQLLAARRFKVGRSLRGDRTPTLILASGADHLVPRSNSLRLHQLIPGSAYKMVKGAGHEITLGQEREITLLVKDFTSKKKSKVEAV